MGKFEYGLIGVMAFLILGILGIIAVSPDSNYNIEITEDMKNMDSSSEPKSTATVSLGGESLEPEPEVTIGESLEVEIIETESESEIMEETEPALEVMEEKTMTHSHKITIPEGVGVPGCEETNECYIPADISISVGHSVVWNNIDTAAHTVTSGSSSDGPDDIFDSSLFLSGATFEHTFDETGTYDYFCMVHPWMTGTIEVG